MKKKSLFLAAMFLGLGANHSRAGEVFSYFKKANSTAVETQLAPQKPSQPVPEEETLPAPREVAPAPADKNAAAAEKAAPVLESAPVHGSAADCGGCDAHDHFSCAKLKAWLCFRPTRELCPCSCHRAEPCCTPELYTFFLCRYGPNGPCCPSGAGCKSGASECGTRATGYGACAATCKEASPCGEPACGCTYGQKLKSLFQRSECCQDSACDKDACVTSEEQTKPAK